MSKKIIALLSNDEEDFIFEQLTWALENWPRSKWELKHTQNVFDLPGMSADFIIIDGGALQTRQADGGYVWLDKKMQYLRELMSGDTKAEFVCTSGAPYSYYEQIFAEELPSLKFISPEMLYSVYAADVIMAGEKSKRRKTR
jgi:hypothetical protein